MIKRKILYIFCSQNFSGAEIVLKRLIYNNTNNVDPYVVCPPGKFSNTLKDNPSLKVIESESLLSLERKKNNYNIIKLFWILLKKFFKINYLIIKLLNEDFYAVHSNNLAASTYILPSVLFKKLSRKKIKWFWTNHDIYYPHYINRFLARLCVELFNKTLVVSNAVKLALNFRKEKIIVLYNGLDVERFRFSQTSRKAIRDAYEIDENTVLIGMVGSISEEKGHLLLINAFESLSKTHTNLSVIVVGRFLFENNLFNQFLIKTISPSNIKKFIFTGQIEDLPSFYSAMDILVNATNSERSEPLGTTIYESMACERIAIASNTGGTPEIIENGIDGFLFKSDSSENLKETLSFAVSQIANLDHIKKNARQKVIQKFNIENMTKSYNEILGPV